MKDYNLTENMLQSILKLHRALMHQSKQMANKYDLSVPQFVILMMLRRKDVFPQKLLQKHTHLPKSTLSYAIDSLVNENIVTRNILENNRRETVIYLTTTGKELIQSICSDDEGIEVKFDQAIEEIGQSEIEKFIDLNKQLTEWIEKEGEKA